jgi:SOS response regulatory protein OraA/RecX
VALPRNVVTALRADRPGRVVVELDGARWRTLPVEAVVRAGVESGAVLDRPRARTLARELRRLRAFEVAARSLRSRDRSTLELAGRLEARGIATAERELVLRTLGSAGLVDDARFAAGRARALAERGAGDALIRDDLERRGVAADAIAAALGALRPEGERAAAIVTRRGSSPATARFLAARGFDEAAIEGAVAWDDGEGVG